MEYSLNKILNERLSFDLPSASKEELLIYKLFKNPRLVNIPHSTVNKTVFFEKIFLINEQSMLLYKKYYQSKYDLVPSASAVNSFYAKNYNPSQPQHWNNAIKKGFDDNQYLQLLFERIKSVVWEGITPDNQDKLLKYRKDIFGDFRYDSITNNILDSSLIKTIEYLLDQNSKDAFIYVILLFILISIFHDNINTFPMCYAFNIEKITSVTGVSFAEFDSHIFGDGYNVNSATDAEISEYNKTFVHDAYKNFKVYIYDDIGNYTSVFCCGDINFCDDGRVILEFINEKTRLITKYSGKAYLFTNNKMVHIHLTDDNTHRGALICFHYTDFIKEPKKCFLRKGLFIATGAADESYRMLVKNIIFLHKEPKQKELIMGLLKCCNMRNEKEFIIIHKTALTKFINSLHEFNLICGIDNLNLIFEEFFYQHENNEYFLVRENEFLDFLMKNFKSYLDEWSHIEITLLLKSFSELPNAIYSYPISDPTFYIFK